MEYLDEETLVWDESQQKHTQTGQSGPAAEWANVDATQAYNEFLRHFDKAENQLINISSELLAITLKIPSLPEPDDLTVLRHQLVESINDVKARGAGLNYPVAVIDKLCFLYAVVLDELIIYSDWGEKRGWENKTLLSELFGMRNGGELFFTVADKAMRQPQKLVDLLDIIYLFLSIGFRGQFRDKGSEQLKTYVNQLEQILSQYRQTGGIFCHTRVKLPKVRQPVRRKRYMVTALFFSCLIATSVGLTHFWYNNTHPQRVRDFNNLDEFSQRYVISGEVKDIVFISQDEDLIAPPHNGSKVELVEATPPATLGTSHSSWLVQLATFSSEKNASAFISTLAPSAYSPEIDEFDSYYRVIIRSDSSQQARDIKAWYQENDNISAIIVRNTKKEAQ